MVFVQAEEEVCRLARESGQQMATKWTKQSNHWNTEQVNLEANLAACERKISELSLSIANAPQVGLNFLHFSVQKTPK